MIEAMRWLGILIMATLKERRDLALENLALRQQLGVLERRNGVPLVRFGQRKAWWNIPDRAHPEARQPPELRLRLGFCQSK